MSVAGVEEENTAISFLKKSFLLGNRVRKKKKKQTGEGHLISGYGFPRKNPFFFFFFFFFRKVYEPTPFGRKNPNQVWEMNKKWTKNG